MSNQPNLKPSREDLRQVWIFSKGWYNFEAEFGWFHGFTKIREAGFIKLYAIVEYIQGDIEMIDSEHIRFMDHPKPYIPTWHGELFTFFKKLFT